MPGQTFTPGSNRTTEQRNPNNPLQQGAEALRQLSLRLPQTLGGSPIAPTSLLTPRAGGGIPSFLGLQQAAQGLNRAPAAAPGGAGAGLPQGPVPTPGIGAPGGGGQNPGLMQLLQQLFGGSNNPFTQAPIDQGPGGQGSIPSPNIGFGGGGMNPGPGSGMSAVQPPAPQPGGAGSYGGGGGGFGGGRGIEQSQ